MMKTTRLKSKNITRPEDPCRSFTVPQGYFEALADRVWLQASTIEKTETALKEVPTTPRKPSKAVRTISALAVTAVVALLIAIPSLHRPPHATDITASAVESPLDNETNIVESEDAIYYDLITEDMTDEVYSATAYGLL